MPQRDKPKSFVGSVPWCRIEDIDGVFLSQSKSQKCVTPEAIAEMPLRVFPEGTVIVSCSADLGRCAIVSKPLVTNQTFIGLVPKPEMTSKFLYYLMTSKADELNAAATGATIKYLSQEKFGKLGVAVPSSLEQRRIVGLLDEAFAGIALAKANAERNLQNARDLYESHLHSVFARRGLDWKSKTIAECFKVRSGVFLPGNRMVASGEFNVYGGNGVAGRHNQKNLTGENIILGRVGAKCGNIHYVTGDVWVTDNALIVSEYYELFDLRFLTELLRHKNLRSRANQMAQPVISFRTIKDVLLEFPPSKERQAEISRALSDICDKTRQLSGVYERKLVALEALKKSFLSQAFCGEL